MQIRPVSDLRNKFTDIEKIVSSVEAALDKADKLAEETSVRYTHEEVFDKIRRKVN